jgi:hypothetical protein
MDKRFLRAFLTPSQTRLEGYTLYPWCLKHRIWLEGIESPLMRPDAPIEAADLIIALQICSERPVGRLTLRERWLAYRLHEDKDRFRKACAAFVDHMDTAQRWPKFLERKKSGEPGDGGVPWQLGVVANLCKNGVSLAEALEMPEPKAIWLSSVFAIQAGAKLDIISTELEELIDSGAFDEPPQVENNQ